MAVILLFSCRHSDRLSPGQYLSKDEQDTLLVDIVTYVYLKPPGASNQTRHQSEYRQYYIEKAKLFSLENYYKSEDGTHYFYLLRPAHQGQKRGVGGKYTVSPNEKGSLRLKGFEELYVTVVMPEDSLKETGRKITSYLLKHGHLDIYLYDPAIVEWPDRRLQYDKTDNEWRYNTK